VKPYSFGGMSKIKAFLLKRFILKYNLMKITKSVMSNSLNYAGKVVDAHKDKVEISNEL